MDAASRVNMGGLSQVDAVIERLEDPAAEWAVVIRSIRVAVDREAAAVVPFEHVHQQRCRRVLEEIAGKIADAERASLALDCTRPVGCEGSDLRKRPRVG